ncbi:hypothetical protein ACT691_08695 [Vibrio metschnikovii]
MITLNGILLRPLMDLLAGIALLTLVAIFGFSGTELIGVGVLYAFISYLGQNYRAANRNDSTTGSDYSKP